QAIVSLQQEVWNVVVGPAGPEGGAVELRAGDAVFCVWGKPFLLVGIVKDVSVSGNDFGKPVQQDSGGPGVTILSGRGIEATEIANHRLQVSAMQVIGVSAEKDAVAVFRVLPV